MTDQRISDEHLIWHTIRKAAAKSDGEVRVHYDGRLIAGTSAAQALYDYDAALAEVARLRGVVQTIRDWAHTNHGGSKTPAEVWPGLAAALAAAEGLPVPTDEERWEPCEHGVTHGGHDFIEDTEWGCNHHWCPGGKRIDAPPVPTDTPATCEHGETGPHRIPAPPGAKPGLYRCRGPVAVPTDEDTR